MTYDHDAVRAASRAALADYGLIVPDHLPWLERVPPRPRDEVVARTLALYAITAIVAGAPLEVVHESMVTRDLERHLSSTERAYLTTRLRGETPSERDEIRLSWRSESLRALGWALHLFDDLPLAGHASDDDAPRFAPLDPFGEGSGPDPAVQPRVAVELLATLDRFYCAHWAVEENRLSGRFEPWPQVLVPGAIVERRHALEWLLDPDAQDWDGIGLNT